MKLKSLVLLLVILLIPLAGCDMNNNHAEKNTDDFAEQSIEDGTRPEQGAEYVEDEYLVFLEREDISSSLTVEDNNIETSNVVSNDDTRIEKITSENSLDIQTLDNKIDIEGYRVRNITRNYKYHTLASNFNWNHREANVDTAWEEVSEIIDRKKSAEIQIAVLDTGVDYDHEALRNYINRSLSENFTEAPDIDRNGHGTAVSGLVTSHTRNTGSMYEAELINIKVMFQDDSGNGVGYAEDIMEGLYYAREINVDVINMSLGGYHNNDDPITDEYDKIFRSLRERGIVTVAAAGNNDRVIEGATNSIYPAASPYTLTVGATAQGGYRAGYSNWGESLHVMAPGHEVLAPVSSHADSNTQYGEFAGTSMASPFVAGQVGTLIAADDSLSPDTIRKIIKGSACVDEIPEESYFEDYDIGDGLINVYHSIARTAFENVR